MSENRERNERGQFVETVTAEDVLEVVRTSPSPIVTAKEVGETLGCTAEAVRQKLLSLQDRGVVARRKVGAGAVVWWAVADEELDSSPEFDSSDPLFADPATFTGGAADVSENADEYLTAAIASEHDSDE